jgi:two-component sensor histidine kinase
VRARRTKDLEIEIVDDGPGLSGDAIEEGLGLSIVRTIVTQDLRGSLDIANRTDSQGVHVRLKIPLNE